MTDSRETEADEGSRSSILAAVARAAAAEISRHSAHPLAAGLYLVATPIGNLGDITLRALAVLAEADTVYCEDTRHSGVLMHHFGLKARLKPYHEHNAEEQRPRVLAELQEGKRVALISDAGTPLVSDPGYKLVREACDAGHAVVAIPGASALLTGIVVSALPTDSFFFAGFLPPKSAARRARIKELQRVPATLVFFEAPQRVADCLADLQAELGNRPAAIARELTKLHEEIARGTLETLAHEFSSRTTKGECVIVVGPPVVAEASEADIRARLVSELARASLRDAAKTVADELGVAKSRVYEMGLKLKSDDVA